MQMNQATVSALKKSLLTNTKIKLKQEKIVPPHPAVISREKQKNKKHRRRPIITPKEMNKITTVSFLHTVHDTRS